MKIITTWHCTEILQGEGCEATPREWLILVGPGEDLIFEVKTARRPTNKETKSATLTLIKDTGTIALWLRSGSAGDRSSSQSRQGVYLSQALSYADAGALARR